MDMQTCPVCTLAFVPPLEPVRWLALPPTGGDYEWASSTERFACPHCTAALEVSVKRDLDGSHPVIDGPVKRAS